MKHRRLDADWDYCFGHGKQDYLEGRETVAQAIKTRLLLLYGEWWEDQEDGLPLFQKILAGSARESNLEAIDLIFRERIGNTPGVLAILRFDSSFGPDKRDYEFNCDVETIYGTLYVSNVKEAS